MRILTVVDGLGLGGTERAAQNYALAYQARGHPSAVLAVREGGLRAAVLREAGIEVLVASTVKRELDQRLGKAAAWGPDLIHVHRTGHADPVSGYVLRELRRTTRPTTRVVETNVFARVDRSPDRFTIDVHLQLSSWCLWKWQRWSRRLTPAPLGVVLPYLVSIAAFSAPSAPSQFRRQIGVPERAVLYGRIGQPLAAKWSATLLSAFAAVADEDPRAWLLVVGLPDALAPALDALPPTARSRVVRLPPITEDSALRQAYRAIDIFVHVSAIGESFGMVLAESLLAERPVVTLATPMKDNSQTAVVGHCRGGLVVHRPQDLPRAMRVLADDPVLAQRLGRGGRAWVSRSYSEDVVMRKLLRLVGHLRASRTSADLARRVRADGDLQDRVDRQEIRRLATEGLGRVALAQRVLVPIIHEPIVYGLWSRRTYRPDQLR